MLSFSAYINNSYLICFIASIYKKDIPLRNIFLWSWWESLYFVELVGVEPTSAQGNHTLSTRLFQPSVFEYQQDLDHQLIPYPQNFHPTAEASVRLFPICLRRLIKKIRNNIP